MDRAPYAALASRIQVRLRLKSVIERERFHSLVTHAFKQAGAQHTLLSDSGLELLRQASRGLPRYAGRILKTSLQLAVPKGLNHLPDELIQQAIEEWPLSDSRLFGKKESKQGIQQSLSPLLCIVHELEESQIVGQ